MNVRNMIIRVLAVLAVSTFAGTAISEFLAGSSIPEELQAWQAQQSVRSGAFTFVALSSVILGLVGYACAMFIQRWAAFVLLSHLAAFVAANAMTGPHIYMGQTQALFLLYMSTAGALIAILSQKPKPNADGAK